MTMRLSSSLQAREGRGFILLLLLLLFLFSSPRFVFGQSHRKILELGGKRDESKPPPPPPHVVAAAPNLALSWGNEVQDVAAVIESGIPTASGETDANPAAIIDEPILEGREDGSERMGFPEMEAQEYYKFGVLESLAQILKPQGTPNIQTDQKKSCSTVPEEVTRYANLVILSRALEVTGLADALNNVEAETTMFAPTDLAFEILAESQGRTVDELLEDKEHLSKVLKLHLAPSALQTYSLGASQSVDTFLVGHPILVTSSVKGILVVPPGGDAAQIQLADISACNSVIHIIDHVLSHVEDWDLGMFTG